MKEEGSHGVGRGRPPGPCWPLPSAARRLALGLSCFLGLGV